MAINDPRDIPGLVAWYSAEAETGYTDGQAMTSWTDLSGNGNHATPSTAAPLWRSAGGAASGPSIQFDTAAGVAFRYWALPSTLMGSATSGEIMVQILGLNASSGLWRFGSAGAASSDANHYAFSGSIYDSFGLSTGKRQGFAPTLSILSWRRYNTYAANNDWQAFLDGTSQKTYTTGGAVSWATSNVLLGATVSNGAVGNGFRGSMAAAIIYNRKLTTTERADLNTWLAAHPSGGTVATTVTGTLAATAPAASVSLTGEVPVSGTLDVTAPAAVVDMSDQTFGDLTATAPPADVSMIGDTATAGPLVLAAPPATVAFAGSVGGVAAGTLALTAPAARVALAGTATAVIGTDTSNDLDGIVIDGYATVETTTAVTPTPAGRSRGERYAKALPYPTPDIVNGRPT